MFFKRKVVYYIENEEKLEMLSSSVFRFFSFGTRRRSAFGWRRAELSRLFFFRVFWFWSFGF